MRDHAEVSGMMEAHVNDAVRTAPRPKRGTLPAVVILTETEQGTEALVNAVRGA